VSQNSVVRAGLGRPTSTPDQDPISSSAVSGTVIVSESVLPDGAATSAKQDTLLTELQLKANLTETQPVSIADPISLEQNVVVSAVNSSVANLAAGASFTGSWVSTLKVAGIQVSLKADQNCTVYVQQSSDGANADISDPFYYNKISDNFGTTVQVVSSYARVVVTNLSSTSATTYLRLQSILCPIVSSMPRALDEDQHLKVTLHGMADHYGFDGQFTPMRDLKIAQPVRVVGSVFGSAIDTNYWTASTSGVGSASGVASGIATIASGTANSGYGQLTSVRTSRFVFAHPNQFRGLIRIPTVVTALNTRRWGAFSVSTTTPQNGVYFELSAAGVISVNCVSGTTVNSVASGSFNGTISEYTVDTNVHAYEIIHFTAGAWFYIDNILVHKFVPTTSVLFQSLDVPIAITSINTASGTASGVIECFNSSILKLGKNETSPSSKYQSGTTAGVVLKIGSGILHCIAVSGVANNSVVTLYDNTAASGTILWSSGAMAGNTVPFSINLTGVTFYTGLTLDITAANSTVTVSYE